jgi:hypothetical protein
MSMTRNNRLIYEKTLIFRVFFCEKMKNRLAER